MGRRNFIPIFSLSILIMSICHTRSQNLLEYVTASLRRRLVGSNCVVVEVKCIALTFSMRIDSVTFFNQTGKITPRAYCDGCHIEEATACVRSIDFHSTKSYSL